MSRIGKLPIALSDKVKAEVSDNIVKISGANKVTEYKLSHGVTAKVEEDQLKIFAVDKSVPKITMFVGMDRSNLNNIVSGLKEPFKAILEVNGVGYKFTIKEKVITLSLGYSHDIIYILPDSVSAVFEKPNFLVLTGEDKVLIGKVASEISSFRKTEPYKGKGVRLKGSYVRRKEGKKK